MRSASSSAGTTVRHLLLPIGPALIAAALLTSASIAADEPAVEPATPSGESAKPAEAPAAATNKSQELTTEQENISKRYQELEKVMLRMAELTAGTDPR